ncbi:heavy-metal-associated domain-containing protein [Streptomyces sp. TRM S81-3]|uniref:Heavy-metal-associated domain-containing protein n=1 Tax=Streptomyces griseicoloratus TaxID=2752516 RepID=A0A926KYY6_9ACTN|nr:heavy-metal-associated domain-containing protein [Streptomyces griseicoloratus]MBD0419308.1 heavy-metal-associated domain-containing protein [Streptomyces griseicoloratus]
MTASTYTIRGMACGHCAESVTKELERIAGVTAVTVDVDSGKVVVTCDTDLKTADVRAAVEQAGYELTAEETSFGEGDSPQS